MKGENKLVKRQTVWLLTMLSLMIVLSAYYMLSDKEDLAYIDQGESDLDDQIINEEQSEATSDVEIDDVQNVGGSDFFTTIRMELQDKRNLQKDRLLEVVGANNSSANEINEALNEIDYLEKIESKEAILQETILSTDENYEDVLVRADESKVHVHVITDSLSKEAAVHIMQMVRDETGIENVDVNFQPVNG